MTTIKIVLTALLLPILSNLMTAQSVGLSMDKLKTPTFTVGIPPQYRTAFFKKITLKTTVNQAVSTQKPIAVPSIFSVEALPFFCKIEYKMGLNHKLPVKFRLGDVQYVDQLEGKH